MTTRRGCDARTEPVECWMSRLRHRLASQSGGPGSFLFPNTSRRCKKYQNSGRDRVPGGLVRLGWAWLQGPAKRAGWGAGAAWLGLLHGPARRAGWGAGAAWLGLLHGPARRAGWGTGAANRQPPTANRRAARILAVAGWLGRVPPSQQGGGGGRPKGAHRWAPAGQRRSEGRNRQLWARPRPDQRIRLEPALPSGRW
jgi:hypothetical protein